MKRSVHSKIRINSDSEQIIKALVNIDEMQKWWGVDSGYIEKRDGGLYTLLWMRNSDGIKFISTGRINLYNFRSHLYLEDLLYINYEKPILGPFSLKFDVEKHTNYCNLTVNHSGFEKGGDWDWYYDATLDGWSQALVMLKTYLEKL